MQGWSIIIISELFSGPKLREGWLIAWLVWRSPFKCVYIFSNVITYYSGDLRATAPSRVTDAFSLSNTQLQKNPLVSSRSVQKKKILSLFAPILPSSCDAHDLFSQRNEDSLVYSEPRIIARKSGKRGQLDVRRPDEFSTYADVCLVRWNDQSFWKSYSGKDDDQFSFTVI